MVNNQTQIEPEDESTSSPSLWAYLIASVVIGPLIVSLLAATTVGLMNAPDVVFIPWMIGVFILANVSILLIFAFPLLLYRDTKQLASVTNEWSPNTPLWIAGGVVGYFIPLLQQAIGLAYLYKRRQYTNLR
jgi:ABC-type polysaccharide/polyol phosphate export permease